MKAYLLLGIGAVWLMLAVTLHTRGFGIYVDGVSRAAAMRLFRLLVPIIFWGWLAPFVVGAFLLRTR